MQTKFGELLREARGERGLTLQELAARIGYRNLNKGARRIEHLERGGEDKQKGILGLIAAALGLDAQRVADCQAVDEEARRQEFDAWRRQPQPMKLWGYVAGVAFGLPLPAGLTDEEALTYAVALQKQRRVRMCLVLDRQRSLWISLDGKHGLAETSSARPNFPYTIMG